MARGRKSTPTPLKLIKGNPGRRPINENEPTFEKVKQIPDAPAWLTEQQILFWKDLAPMLIRTGVLTEGDLMTLSLLCIALAELKIANENVQTARLIRTPNGHVQSSPYVGILHRSLSEVTSLCAEFGMTPASRSRVQTLAGVKPEDEFARYLNRGNKKKA